MAMRSKASFLRAVRLVHLYLGVFIAPALFFFAFTGALQTFSLHETTRGSDYNPPRWAVVLGQLHKKQTVILPQRRPPAPDRAPAGVSGTPTAPAASQNRGAGDRPAPAHPPAPVASKRHPLPLKIFFLIVAVGLFISSLTGIYMAFKYSRKPLLIAGLLLAGTVIPVSLIFV